MRKITLQVNGQKMTFSKEELTYIVEEHLSKKITMQLPIFKVAQKPTENMWFEVKPQDIDEKLFEIKRWNEKQEEIRHLIIQAFDQMRLNPEKYARNFKTMMPKKSWKSKTVGELEEIACELGDHNADWVEQALEWAQRISNGESWEAICNAKDTAKWHRLVQWKKGRYNLVGGSVNSGKKYLYPVSFVDYYNFNVLHNVHNAVPLVVFYE